MEKRKLTVDGLAKDQPIYVRNRSNGDFLLTLYRQDGSSELVPIPRTFIPVLVTNFAEPAMFKRSSDFRRSIAKRVLELIEEETALKELAEEASIIELERLRKEEFSDLSFQEDAKVTPLEAIEQMGEGELSLRVRDTIVRTDITEDDKIALLMAEYKNDNVSKEDLELIATTTDKGSSLSKWASRMLKKL